MMTGALFTAVVLLTTGFCSGENVLPPGPMNGALGESVMFNTSIGSAGPFITIIWNFNGGSGSGSVLVVTVTPGGTTPTPGYLGRISVNNITGSMELRELTLGDIGRYTVSMVPNIGDALNGETTLKVYEKISGAEITGPSEPLIAGSSSANLSYQAAAGTSISREWLKDDQPLSPSNRITFSEDKSSVSISPVESSDNGEYQCRLSNPVSTDTARHTLTVNYGPQDVVINGTNTGESTAEVNSRVTLKCSAVSLPPANFLWLVNGTERAEKSIFTIEKFTPYDAGNYTCVASNDVTGLKVSAKHSVKGSSSIQVVLTTVL
ncbi:hypothetical protein JZ751_028227 [Albula glossodonta]|uniref:Ig-like domain-containing protein n=1 Tax=Albula glossodonta TaxID=121402 RepID=A0A8T2NEI9_9TELE|nr:hypothetical protein JZ751_028227 [Albula glossodonta]